MRYSSARVQRQRDAGRRAEITTLEQFHRRATTRTCLTVHAEADTNSYPRGIKISDAQMAALAPLVKPDKFHGESWMTEQRHGTEPSGHGKRDDRVQPALRE